jgi:uncharacterized protein (DUF849 family)
VGLEDSIYRPRPAAKTPEVAKIRRLIEELGYEVATPTEARATLGLKGPDRTKF